PSSSRTICICPNGISTYRPGKPAPAQPGPICLRPRFLLFRFTPPSFLRMSTQPQSTIVDTLAQGLILDVRMEDLQFTAYVVVRGPDINLVGDVVPAEQFDQDGDVRVTAISRPDEVRSQIQDIVFNRSLGDAAVFL